MPEDGPRFLTLTDVAEILATSVAQVRALVSAGELRSIQIGGRHQHRVETVELEKYIAGRYAESDARAAERRRQQEQQDQQDQRQGERAEPDGPDLR